MTLKRTMCALLAASLLASGVVLTQSSASANTVDAEKSEVTTDLAASYGLAANKEIIFSLPPLALLLFRLHRHSPTEQALGTGSISRRASISETTV